MSAFNHLAASRRLKNTTLGLNNRRLVEYWLSLWVGDTLPLWPSFDRNVLDDLSSGMAVFELHLDDRLICTFCGDAIRRASGIDLTGQDWLALAPADQRASRLQGFRAVTVGAIGHSMRHGRHRSGAVHYAEEILLPFAALPTGALPVLAHVGWRPTGADATGAEIINSASIPDEVTMISLGA